MSGLPAVYIVGVARTPIGSFLGFVPRVSRPRQAWPTSAPLEEPRRLTVSISQLPLQPERHPIGFPCHQVYVPVPFTQPPQELRPLIAREQLPSSASPRSSPKMSRRSFLATSCRPSKRTCHPLRRKHGLTTPLQPRPGPRPPVRHQRRPLAGRRLHNRQQGVRVGPQGHHPRRPDHHDGQRLDRGRRRHREHV